MVCANFLADFLHIVGWVWVHFGKVMKKRRWPFDYMAKWVLLASLNRVIFKQSFFENFLDLFFARCTQVNSIFLSFLFGLLLKYVSWGNFLLSYLFSYQISDKWEKLLWWCHYVQISRYINITVKCLFLSLEMSLMTIKINTEPLLRLTFRALFLHKDNYNLKQNLHTILTFTLCIIWITIWPNV